MSPRYVSWLSLTIFFTVLLVFPVEASKLRCIMYLTGQHNVVPELEAVKEVTHVALAFMQSEIFNVQNQDQWPLFTNVEEVRAKFVSGTIIQVAIGGWGDTKGFSTAAKTETSRKMFAKNIKTMLDATGADGVDIDWEYPGGNGEDYKTIPNSEKQWEIDAYPKLLAEIRASIGPSKIMSAAVPGLPRDMLAFTRSTIPKIMESLDFLNVMTYDLINRRDDVTNHHTGKEGSLRAIHEYINRGLLPEKANLGLAFYLKWFKTALDEDCQAQPVGCKTELMEDPNTGADIGKAAGFSWHDQVPAELSNAFQRATKYGSYDHVGGGNWYWDKEERIFWTWDAEDSIQKKLKDIVEPEGLGGIFAWGLGEDAPDFKHLKAATEYVAEIRAQYEQSSDGKSEL